TTSYATAAVNAARPDQYPTLAMLLVRWPPLVAASGQIDRVGQRWSCLGEQVLQVVPIELAGKALLAQDIARQRGLALLQVPDLLLDGSARQHAIGDHRARLHDAVAAIDRLA